MWYLLKTLQSNVTHDSRNVISNIVYRYTSISREEPT